jgi:hypothetical protein
MGFMVLLWNYHIANHVPQSTELLLNPNVPTVTDLQTQTYQEQAPHPHRNY